MPYYTKQIKDEFFQLKWNQVYDFLEFLISIGENDPYKNSFISKINQVFLEEKVPYKIIDEMVVPLISNEEVEEVSKVLV